MQANGSPIDTQWRSPRHLSIGAELGNSALSCAVREEKWIWKYTFQSGRAGNRPCYVLKRQWI